MFLQVLIHLVSETRLGRISDEFVHIRIVRQVAWEQRGPLHTATALTGSLGDPGVGLGAWLEPKHACLSSGDQLAERLRVGVVLGPVLPLQSAGCIERVLE